MLVDCQRQSHDGVVCMCSHLNPHNTGQGKSSTSQWVKVGSGGRRQWSSTESGYSTDGGRRGNVSKAGSLAGVTLLSRNDSHGSGSVLCKTGEILH
jgi:hypothetical protein